jgi:hypothetical protein
MSSHNLEILNMDTIYPGQESEKNTDLVIPVGLYLLKRLKELGVRSIFGVPGGTWTLLLLKGVLLIY